MSLDYQINTHKSSESFAIDLSSKAMSKKNINQVIKENFTLRKLKNNKKLNGSFSNQVGFNLSRSQSKLEEVDERVACRYCMRLFINERIEIHQKICENNYKNHRFSKKSLQKPSKKNDFREDDKKMKSLWRKQHIDLINKLRGIESPNEYNDYIICNECGRKFAVGPGEKHIKKCKEIINKPRPLYKNAVIRENDNNFFNGKNTKKSLEKLLTDRKIIHHRKDLKVGKIKTRRNSFLDKIKREKITGKRNRSIISARYSECFCICGEILPNRAVYCMICGICRYTK